MDNLPVFNKSIFQFIDRSSYPILHALGNGNYTDLFTAKDHVLYSVTLAKVVIKFPYLLRVSKCEAVNPTAIQYAMHDPKHKKACIVTKNNKIITVSRRRITDVLNAVDGANISILTGPLQ